MAEISENSGIFKKMGYKIDWHFAGDCEKRRVLWQIFLQPRALMWYL